MKKPELSKLHIFKRRSGIQSRIMLCLALFVVLIVALLWVFQVVLLDDFYSMYRRQQVNSTADTVIRNIDNEELSILAEHLAEQNDLCILVLDENNRPLLSVEGQRRCILHRINNRTLLWLVNRAKEQNGPVTEIFDMQPNSPDGFNPRRFQGPMPDAARNDEKSVLYARQITLSNGSTGTLLVNAIITPVTSTLDALRFQLTWITLIVLFIAMVLAVLLTKRIARPIVETNQAAQALARGRYQPPKLAHEYREIAELNDTLSKAAVELGKVETLQHELIANISHDLRTPLTMIGGYAEMMRDLPGESTPENMQVIMDETARLTTLVNELLDFSRLQSGSIAMNPAVFDLTAAVKAIISRIGKLTEKDGYTIRFSPDQHVQVLADETRISQVIYNLIGNALTYTGEDKTVSLTQQLTGSRVRINIRDTGKGIASEELPLIWNRYYRTQETHKRAVVGSGLGLNIVRAILEQHNAPYGVNSTPGQGTDFWFELPLHPEDTPQKEGTDLHVQ